MKKILIVMMAFMMAVTGVFAQTSQVDRQGSKSAAVVYTCPMHPDVTSDKPGKCPKCGMTLVAKKAAAAPAGKKNGSQGTKKDSASMAGMKM